MNSESRKFPAVLVVEDEPLIRLDAVDEITDAGFKTYDAASADAAITLMERHEDIAILFTDVDMPGSMDGLELAAYVRNEWPSVTIVITSGMINIDEKAMPKGSLFLSKPYATSLLTKTLHDITVQLE